MGGGTAAGLAEGPELKVTGGGEAANGVAELDGTWKGDVSAVSLAVDATSPLLVTFTVAADGRAGRPNAVAAVATSALNAAN